jgi:hypothetical protein
MRADPRCARVDPLLLRDDNPKVRVSQQLATTSTAQLRNHDACVDYDYHSAS